MYESLASITLSSGETVQAACVKGPDPEWAERIEKLLGHKGDPWNWQNTEVLRQELGIEAWFYILHRDGRPFSNILTIDVDGVGLFGHVYTTPEDRQKGASSSLFRIQMEHFRARGGRALFLGTGYDTHPYRMYAKHGFTGIEPLSGRMEYYATSKAAFDAWYFGAGPAEVEPIQWAHWPAGAALFLGDWPGVVRCAPLKLFGRMSTEGPLLPALRRAQARRQGEPICTAALRSRRSGAVVGLAAWEPDPLWPNTALADVYCHPAFQERAGDLLDAIHLPTGMRVVAYADAACPAKADALARAGFRATATLRDRVATSGAKSVLLDVTQFER